MVGRPKTKAKHVQSLADQQYALNDRLFAECPPMYLDGTDRRDPLAQSWRSAIEAAADIQWDCNPHARRRGGGSSVDSRSLSDSRSP